MNKYIQFGDNTPVVMPTYRSAMADRASVCSDGLESNGFTEYDHEVKFENIAVDVNVCRVKAGESDYQFGVAKGALVHGIPITVPTNSSGATMHAMKKRCDYKPQSPNMDVFKKGHNMLMAKIPRLDTIRVDSDMMSEYFKTCAPGKAERLLAALNGHEWKSEMGTKHVFAKQEALLKEHGAQPRIVYQGTDMYNALTGPVVMELNSRMQNVFSLENPLNVGNRVVYACGVNGTALGDIMEQSPGVAIECDMKNNDGSQSKEFRKYEAMFYKKLGAPDWFVREFAKNTSIRVWTRYGVAATVEGERWSGETTTTTGNSYVGMVNDQAAMDRAGVKTSTNVQGGDDQLKYVSGVDPVEVGKAIETVARDVGMRAEVVVQPSRHHATFYRKRFVRSTIGTRPVPQFGRVLAKLNLRPNRNSAVNDRDYMSGKYLCAAYEHRHVPAIRDILINTSQVLSDDPYLDVRTTKIKEMGDKANIVGFIQKSQVIPLAEIGDYLQEVYDISHNELIEEYERVAQSCLDYCDKWTYVGKNGKVYAKANSRDYKAPKLQSSALDSLSRVDVGY